MCGARSDPRSASFFVAPRVVTEASADRTNRADRYEPMVLTMATTIPTTEADAPKCSAYSENATRAELMLPKPNSISVNVK